MKGKKLLAVFLLFIAVTLTVYFFKFGGGFANNNVFDDFAIEDTTSIDRILITDNFGQSVDLIRNEDLSIWEVKDKFRAKDYSVKILLKAFHNVKVKGKVPVQKRDNVIKSISSRGTKVEIYSDGDVLKTYLIGSCTEDQKGTYAVLEHGDGERSSEPFILYMDRFTGCLKQRFFTENEEWRYTGIFEYPSMDFSKVELKNHQNPELSFSINYNGGNDIKLIDYEGVSVANFDTLKVKDYLLLYKKVHFETYQSYLTPNGEDSLNRVPPEFYF